MTSRSNHIFFYYPKVSVQDKDASMSFHQDALLPTIIQTTIDDKGIKSRLCVLTRSTRNSSLRKTILHAFKKQENIAKKLSPQSLSSKEKNRYEILVIMEGVEFIENSAFTGFKKLQIIIMANTVKRIGRFAFCGCEKLTQVLWSTNLEVIKYSAFYLCKSLRKVFLPPSCREVHANVFQHCKNLVMFVYPFGVNLSWWLFGNTKIEKVSPIGDYIAPNEEEEEDDEYYDEKYNRQVHEWLRSVHDDYPLHAACKEYDPSMEQIFSVLSERGFDSLYVRDIFGLTGLDYLDANQFSNVGEVDIARYFVMRMMGEGLVGQV
jgi:hypothetical protein